MPDSCCFLLQNASVLHFASFSFLPFIRSLNFFSVFTHNIRKTWGETPLILGPHSAVLLHFFLYLIIFLFSSFFFFIAHIIGFLPKSGSDLKRLPKQKSMHCVFRLSEMGCHYSMGCLCVRWEKASLHLG